MSVACSQRQGVNHKVDWQSEQWLSCHVMAKLNGAFNKVLRKVLLNKVFTMKTAAITFRPTRHEEWRWKRSQDSPKKAKKKKSGTCTQTRKDIQWTARLFSHIQQKMTMKEAAKIMCCLGFTINFQIEGEHTQQNRECQCAWANPWCFAPTYPVGWHFFLCLAYRPVCLVHAWGIAR